MSRVDKLRNAGRGYARIWQDFIKSYHENPTRLYCFFEGAEDPKYYGQRIDDYVFGSKKSLRVNMWCDGKGNLLELFGLISRNEQYTNAWAAFFIDRDFDDLAELPQNDSVYITPCYSVENLYVGSDSFAKILQDEFGLSSIEDDYTTSIDLFERRLEEFDDASEEINAWIFLQRRLEKTNPNGSRMNLRGIKEDKLFTVKLSGVEKCYTIKDFDSLFSCTNTIPVADIEIQVRAFKSCNRTETFRGKYLLFFISKLLKCLVEDSNRKSNWEHFSSRRNVALQISANIISELSQYAETPECLRSFLQRLANKYPQQLNLEVSDS